MPPLTAESHEHLLQQHDDEDDSNEGEANVSNTRPLHVVFCHVDLGIGGAEQLILQLAQASKAAGHSLDIVTTRCDPDHCFAAVKPGGNLHADLHVWGQWIPATIMGRGKALCSALRLAYLAWWTAGSPADVLILDVLPLPLWMWTWTCSAALLFYCHFPDLLLLRDKGGWMKRLYRKGMDGMEEACMKYADVIAVNSKFTKSVVQDTFPSLQKELTVLYPALDTASLEAKSANQNHDIPSSLKEDDGRPMIVSLNRYERKKNLQLVLEAAAWYRTNHKNSKMPQLVIAGGYDLKNTENVEYLKELQNMAEKESLEVTFLQSISDAERAWLLQRATAVMYTPSNEHFGIVPLEVMYSETIIIAVRSGGPMESVVDGVCGYLCDATAAGFGHALHKVLEASPKDRRCMGQAGKQRVIDVFSEARLLREWQEILTQAVVAGRQRTQKSAWRPRTFRHALEAIVMFCIYWMVSALVRGVWDSLGPSLFPSDVGSEL